MLIELRIRDFAVIDEVSIELGAGLHALSGETGAGKSIIVGALSLLLGERASSESVRIGAERANIEAVFDVSGVESVRSRMEELGVDGADGLLILRREVVATGRSRAWVNGSPSTAGIVGELGRRLVDLHGQHESQTLLRADDQLSILDAFAGSAEVAGEVRSRYRTLSEARARLADGESRQRELESRSDFLRFQKDEIDSARLEPGEDSLLKDELKRLEHGADLARESAELHEALYAGEGAVADRLAEIRDRVRRMEGWDPRLADLASVLDDAYQRASEAGQELGRYASGVEHDPARLEEARSRLDQLFRLMRKYGPELQDVIEAGARVAMELDELDGSAFDLDRLREEIRTSTGELNGVAAELGAARRTAAERLAAEVEALLPELGLPGATFRVEFTELPECGPNGGERVEFLVSLNPGFPPRPLTKVASGGELSRVMLALKAILARVDAVPTLVFDEIDAGIGGVVATHVAEKLREVAGHHQVFVITHLPQLASKADRHLIVRKRASDGLAATDVGELAGEDRVQEIARMLGGDPESETSREHARELLKR